MPSGRAKGLLAGSVFLIIVGTLLNISQLFVMAAALFALLGFSYAAALRSARGLTVEHKLPDLISVGQQFTGRIILSGERVLNEAHFNVTMTLPDGVQLLKTENTTQSGAVAVRQFTLVITQRGEYNLGQVAVEVKDPLSLFSLQVKAGHIHNLIAWPEPLNPKLLITPSQGTTQNGQQEISRQSVDGTSIYSVRHWVPGDPLRHVHWPSTARLGELAVMEFDTEASQSLFVALDVRRVPSGEPTDAAFETACGIVSHLLHESWTAGRSVGLIVDGHLLENTFSRAGRLHQREALSILGGVMRTSKEPLGYVLQQAAPRLRGVGTFVLVTTLWDSEAQEAIAQLNSLALDQVVLVVENNVKNLTLEETTPPQCPVYLIGTNELRPS